MTRLTPDTAREILHTCRAHRDTDFHALPSSIVECLVEQARQHGYRKPRNANGSTGRYFHAYLVRLAGRPDQ